MAWLAARIGWEQVKPALRLLAACALAGDAWLAGLPEGYWAVITAVVVMQTDLPQSAGGRAGPGVGELAGAAVALVLIALREQGLAPLPLFAAGLVPRSRCWLRSAPHRTDDHAARREHAAMDQGTASIPPSTYMVWLLT